MAKAFHTKRANACPMSLHDDNIQTRHHGFLFKRITLNLQLIRCKYSLAYTAISALCRHPFSLRISAFLLVIALTWRYSFRQHDSVEVYDGTEDRWDLMDILATLHVDAAVCMLIP